MISLSKPRVPTFLHQRRRDLGRLASASARPPPATSAARPQPGDHPAGQRRPSATPASARPAASSRPACPAHERGQQPLRAAPARRAARRSPGPSRRRWRPHLLVRDEHVAEHHLVEVCHRSSRTYRPDGHPGLAELDEQLAEPDVALLPSGGPVRSMDDEGVRAVRAAGPDLRAGYRPAAVHRGRRRPDAARSEPASVRQADGEVAFAPAMAAGTPFQRLTAVPQQVRPDCRSETQCAARGPAARSLFHTT